MTHARGVKKRNTHADPRAFCGSAEIINPNTEASRFRSEAGARSGSDSAGFCGAPGEPSCPGRRTLPTLRGAGPPSSRPEVSGRVSWWKDPVLVFAGPARSIPWPSPAGLPFPPARSRKTSSQHEPNARSLHARCENLLPRRGRLWPARACAQLGGGDGHGEGEA